MGPLVAVNIAVFALWQYPELVATETMAAHFLVSLEAVTSGRVWTLLTSCFSHVDANHLLFNGIALWVFGRSVELVVGPRRLLGLYLVGGILASIGHVAFGLAAGSDNPALGASGSVMAIGVVYGALFPRQTLLIGFIIPMPAALAVALFIVLDLLGLFGAGLSNIAHAAHLGGAAYGFGWWWWHFRRGRPRPGARQGAA